MVARIYRPARSAMQSGRANTREWLLVHEPSEAKRVEPLMGYTTSGDMRAQVRLSFETAEQAVAYCERHAIPYRVEDDRVRVRSKLSYSDNFRYDRTQPWTH